MLGEIEVVHVGECMWESACGACAKCVARLAYCQPRCACFLLLKGPVTKSVMLCVSHICATLEFLLALLVVAHPP